MIPPTNNMISYLVSITNNIHKRVIGGIIKNNSLVRVIKVNIIKKSDKKCEKKLK